MLLCLFLDVFKMGSEKKLRLGHVCGEDAVCLREILNVDGISVEDLTKRVVKTFLIQRTVQDKARQSRTAQDKARLEKTVQDKARQSRTASDSARQIADEVKRLLFP